MDRKAIKKILVEAATEGNNTPSMLDIPELMGVKDDVEECSSIDCVVKVLKSNKDLLKDVFGLTSVQFNRAIDKLLELKKG